jgi:glycosyltransferase involved in cell wall biosynthesis
MKVAVLSNVSRSAGGLFYAVCSLTKAIAAGDEEFLVVSDTDRFSREDAALWAPLRIAFYRGKGPLHWSRTIREVLDSQDRALVHLHGLWGGKQYEAWRWQRRTGRPVVVSPHGMLDPWAVNNSRWKKRLIGWAFADKALRSATVIHALCESEYESIRAYGLHNPVAVLPNGCELPSGEITGDEPGSRRKRLLFVSRLHPKKGLLHLMEAWGALKAQTDGWQLVIAGWDQGGHEEQVMAQCRQRGVEFVKLDRDADLTRLPSTPVVFAGPRFDSDKDYLMRHCDGFILPSFSEGLPMAILEAWSYRLPVIMTPQCNLPEGFSAGAAVRISPDPSSIADGIAAFLKLDDAGRIAMGERGRRLVEQQFSWNTIGKKMKTVYEWCLTGGTPPDCIRMK